MMPNWPLITTGSHPNLIRSSITNSITNSGKTNKFDSFASTNLRSPVIDNDDQNKQRAVVRVVLYSKEYVKTDEVKDFYCAIKKLISTEVPDLLLTSSMKSK